MNNDDLVWDRWEEVDPLLQRALELSPRDREALVADTAGKDPALGQVLARLVRLGVSDEVPLGPGPELIKGALGPEARLTPGHDERMIGSSIGPYRVTGILGVGGMGTVYLAERVDGLFERQVAIKVLRLALDTPGVVERFELERRILASLSHPAIAQMIDGGVLDDGTPYVVMEHIDGGRIDRYADDRSMTVEERIWLTLAVCEAVDYAHRHMVVHRDLKPSNILVTDEGQVKLLDFGVAKLIGDPGTAGPDPLTRPESRFVTPEYSAPEQIRAEAVTTATDVHALGVLLYELLAGRRPFGRRDSSSFEVQRAVLERTAPPASTAATLVEESVGSAGPEALEAIARTRGTTRPQLRRTLSGDLDAILSKALRKRPEERYGSVEELRADLHRYLTGFPVAAREGLRAYRARKFVARHWLPVGSAAAALTLLVGFTLALVRANGLAVRERDRAETEAAYAQLTVDFLTDVFRGGDPTEAPADTLSARQLLDWGVERVDREFADQPAVQARLLSVFAAAQANRGRLDEAIELAERSVALRRATFGANSEEAADGFLRLAGVQSSMRDFDAAAASATSALGILRSSPSPADTLVAVALTTAGQALWSDRHTDSAAVMLEQALALRRARADDQAGLAGSLLALAPVRRTQGRYEEAESLYIDGIALYRTLPDQNPGHLALHLNNLAFLRRTRGDMAGAVTLYREALAVWTDLYGAGHPTSLTISANLASALYSGGAVDSAEAVLRGRIVAAEENWPASHWRVAAARLALGDMFLRSGQILEAEPVVRAAAEAYSAELGPDHDWTSFAYARLAVVDLLTTDGESGRAVLDRLHGWLARQKADRGGSLSADTLDLLSTLMYVLEAVGPEAEASRFRALLPDKAS